MGRPVPATVVLVPLNDVRVVAFGELARRLEVVAERHAATWTETYAYDTAGNQAAAAWPSTHPEHEATGERAYTGTRITRAGNVRYEHDALGRITMRQKTRLSRNPETWRYEWDAEDRLTSTVTPDGTRWRYTYDALGRRAAKLRYADAGRTVVERTDFTWDGTTLCEQTTRARELPNQVTLTWDHQGLHPIAQTERIASVDAPQDEIDSRFFAIVTDLVGTPSELVDEHGHIAWRTRSTLWGTTAWNTDATGYTPLRFPGQYYAPETGLHYNYFRHYEPETARYATPDPLGLAPAPNPHTYVAHPHTWTDPLGLSPNCKAGQTLGDTSKLSGWIPTEAPEESEAVLRDIREAGVEAQGMGPQRMGPSVPQPFENSGKGGGYKLPEFDSQGNPIKYREWGTAQSIDNPK